MTEVCTSSDAQYEVAVVTAVYNCAPFMDDYFQSILAQTYSQPFQVCIYDDVSTDNTRAIIESYRAALLQRRIHLHVTTGTDGGHSGAGKPKHRAIMACSGRIVCLLDGDDYMADNRIESQLQMLLSQEHMHNTLVGCTVHRLPANATERYTRWANSLDDHQVQHQQYTAYGQTLLAPTWFMSRQLYVNSGGFDVAREGIGFPEDHELMLRMVHAHGTHFVLDRRTHVVYRQHVNNVSNMTTEPTMYAIRLAALERLLSNIDGALYIWSAGKAGKRLYRALNAQYRTRVEAMADISSTKQALGRCELFDEHNQLQYRIPIVSISQLRPFVIICVKQDLTNGEFEQRLRALVDEHGWIENEHFVHFG